MIFHRTRCDHRSVKRDEHKTKLSTVTPNCTRSQFNRSACITADSIDWTQSSASIDDQLDAINFLETYLEHANRDALLDFFSDMARVIRSQTPMNNNHRDHLEFITTRHGTIQRSNNKEKKKKKKEKSNKPQQDTDDEVATKEPKRKSEQKKKHLEESTSTSDMITVETKATPNLQRPPMKTPLLSPQSPTFTIPVPQPTDLLTPDPSPVVHPPQRSNVAQLSQVQQQLQTDTENSSYHRVPSAAHQPIQQHFQALSQMAKNGDEVLITLNINAIHSKASITPSQHLPQTSFPPAEMNKSHQLEIVARGFVRIPSRTEQIPCPPYHGPPSMPIGPPIRPIAPENYQHFCDHCPFSLNKCDDLCQSSLYQPDFRGRPAPGVLINPYYPHGPQSKHKTMFNPPINRTFSSFY